jgi:hypothetical protein
MKDERVVKRVYRSKVKGSRGSRKAETEVDGWGEG